jgi:hypothetical protein
MELCDCLVGASDYIRRAYVTTERLVGVTEVKRDESVPFFLTPPSEPPPLAVVAVVTLQIYKERSSVVA